MDKFESNMRSALSNAKANEVKKVKRHAGFKLVYRSDGEPDRLESIYEDSVSDKNPVLIEAKIKKPDPATF